MDLLERRIYVETSIKFKGRLSGDEAVRAINSYNGEWRSGTRKIAVMKPVYDMYDGANSNP